jgi:4-hydroxythreonine-4-phosphate dehydrogenase
MLSQDFDWVDYHAGSTGAAGALRVLPIELAEKSVCGRPHPGNAAALLEGLRRAVQGCLDGEFSALVTAPLQKSVINDAGIAFSGHTEFLAGLCGSDTPVMLLVADRLRVALVSTHLPLRAVPDYITAERIRRVVEVLHRDLRTRFGIDEPEIVVCGLNPHAGEGGHLGSEDERIIAPAVAALQASGINVRGPLPADTAFTPAAGHADAIVAMYHDQGLPVLKYAGFGHAVNVTLGLPIIRTSVDHGTALDIAGSGRADHGSMQAAVELACRLTAAARRPP